MEYCLSFLYIVMEFQSFIWCLDAFVPRRHEDWKFWGLVGICCIVDFGVLNTVRFPSSAFSIGTSIILFFISILFLYKIKNIVFGFVLTILFYAILYFVSFIVYTITASCLGMSIAMLQISYFPLIAAGSVAHLIILLFAALLKRIHPKFEEKHIQWPFAVLTFMFPCASIIVLAELLSIDIMTSDHSTGLSLCAISLAAANIAVLLLLEWLEKNADFREKQLSLAQTIQLQAKNMTALGKAYTDQRKITHDFNSHLDTISGLLEENDVASAKKFINHLRSKQTTRSLLVNSHHPIMDALLNQKAYAAKSKGIMIHFEINDLSNMKIDAVDMTTMLGNLLDNAIEACEAHKAEKQIQVKVLLGTTLYFSIRNTSNPVKIINDSIASTKSNASLHGFGLENVKSILKKYNGDYVMEYTDGWFLFAGEIFNGSIL